MVQPVAATNAAAAPRSALRLFRPDNAYVALGLAVNHLMTKPAFANCRFGDWSRILVGQINRKHYWLVVDANNQIQGFLGWAVTTKDKAEAWVEGQAGLSFQDSQDGDCVLFNAWAASSLKVNRFILDAARQVIVRKDMVYFKRHYNDGTTRASRLSVNDFVGQHIGANNAPPPDRGSYFVPDLTPHSGPRATRGNAGAARRCALSSMIVSEVSTRGTKFDESARRENPPGYGRRVPPMPSGRGFATDQPGRCVSLTRVRPSLAPA